MTTIHGLHERAAALLDLIHAWVAEHGTPPTYDEMAEACDLSVATIANRLAVLDARGWIHRPGPSAGRASRGITLTNRVWPPAAASTTSTIRELTGSTRT